MDRKRLSTALVILLTCQVLFVSLAQIAAPISNDSNTVNLVTTNSIDVSETDLNRVNTRTEMFPNGGFEDWVTAHEPADLSIVRTQMIDMDLEYSIVSEGARSARLMAKGTDYYHPAQAYLFLQSWSSIMNPANLTVSFDYYIDTLANADLGDCLELYVPFGSSSRNIYYRIGSSMSATNTSSQAYFLIDIGSLQQWNTFSRNVTQDYIDAFGTSSLLYLSRFQFHVISYEYEWSRAYIDNVYFTNGSSTLVGGSINAGNFETGFTGSWWWGFNYDAGSGDVSQSTTRVEGDWSLNVTINTQGDTGYARLSSSIYKMPTTLNKDQFSFYWYIADWQVSTWNSRAYMWVECSNSSDSFYLFYSFGYGGGPQTLGGPNDIEFEADGFNTTGVWNLFNRSIVDDVHSRYPDSDVLIETIYFYVTAEDVGSRISILFDDASLTTSILHDGGYEDQHDVGEPIYGWDGEFNVDPAHTVTDFSCNGEKAANITLENGDELSRYQELDYLQIDDTTEYILDFNWYLETFNQSSNDYLFIVLNFNDNLLIIPIANATPVDDLYTPGEGEALVLLPEINLVGTWVNWHIDIVHTLELMFGLPLDDYIYDIEIWGGTDEGSKLVVFMDDLYIYEDPAPEISDVEQTPMNPAAGGFVFIAATVVDATLSSVTLNYRINEGSWIHTEMENEVGNRFELNITSLLGDAVVEYSITAVDEYGKSSTALDGTEYFSFTVGSSSSNTTTTTTTNTTTTTPTSTPPNGGAFLAIAVIAGVIAVIAVVSIYYILVLKKR